MLVAFSPRRLIRSAAPATMRSRDGALALAGSGRVDPARVVSHVLDWEQLPEALPEKHLKPVFVRDGRAVA